MIDLSCTGCGSVLRVSPEHAGKQVRCPGCGGLTRIPGQPNPVAPPTKPPNPFTLDEPMHGAGHPAPYGEDLQSAQYEPQYNAPQPSAYPPQPGYPHQGHPNASGGPGFQGAYPPGGGAYQPQGQQFPPFHGNQYYQSPESDGLGIAAVILGSIGILGALVYHCIAIPFVIVGLICAFNSRGNLRTAGLVVNFVAIGIMVISFVFCISLFGMPFLFL